MTSGMDTRSPPPHTLQGGKPGDGGIGLAAGGVTEGADEGCAVAGARVPSIQPQERAKAPTAGQKLGSMKPKSPAR